MLPSSTKASILVSSIHKTFLHQFSGSFTNAIIVFSLWRTFILAYVRETFKCLELLVSILPLTIPHSLIADEALGFPPLVDSLFLLWIRRVQTLYTWFCYPFQSDDHQQGYLCSLEISFVHSMIHFQSERQTLKVSFKIRGWGDLTSVFPPSQP